MAQTAAPESEPEIFPDNDERADRISGRVARELRRALIDPRSVPEEHVSDIVGQPLDRVAVFGPIITSLRLATTATSILLASSDVLAGNAVTICAVLVATIYATARSFRPIRYSNDAASLIRVLFEVALHVALVAVTGRWGSPLVFSLVTSVIVAGFARGFAFALRIGAAAAIAISGATFVSDGFTPESIRTSATWSGTLLLISVVAGYGRRVSGEADRERTIALDRLSRLADANALLYSLHRVAQTLPASLDMNDVLDSTVQRLRGLIDFDALAVLLFDDTDAHWQVIRKEGCHLPIRLGPTDLQVGLRRTISEGGVISIGELDAHTTVGIDERSRSGLYATLSARGSIIGLIALESRQPNRFDHRAGGLLNGFVPPLALALDNARWFARLRTVGADEERTRIARDLHDRIGQSLAYLAFELDRIVNRTENGDDIGEAVHRLRDDVRGVIREVRDTLYDLRTDVSDDQSLPTILEQYVPRVTDRTALDFVLDLDRDQRLPLLQEREMWRITQEAITNIERHAKATKVQITWRCDGERAAVRVSDDGQGFEIGRAGRLDSYGMLGMRERASSIGATLDVTSISGTGTSITCVLDPSSQNTRLHTHTNGGPRT